MAAKPRQLNQDELLRLKWLLGGVTALVSVWTVFFLDIEALGLVAVVSAAIGAVLVWPGLSARIPALAWKLAVPAIIVALAVDAYFSPDTLPVLIRLSLLLVLYRALAYRRKREDLQLLVLGLFLIVVAGVLTVAVEFAFLLLLFTACALGFLFVINLVDASGSGAVRTAEAETAWTRIGWRRFFARLREVADWRMLAFASALFVAVVAMSGLLFLIIPRFELASGFFLDRYITRKSRSGFTDTVRFGDVTELVKDDSIAMRVDLTDTSGLRDDPYWRLVVLDEYTPEGFKVSTGLKNELLNSERVVQNLSGRAFGRRVEEVGGIWTFYVEPGVSRYLPLPGSFGFLRLRDNTPLQRSSAHRIVALRTEPMTMTAFQLERVETGPQVMDAQLPELLRADRGNPAAAETRTRADPRLLLRGPEGEPSRAVLRRVLAEITGGEKLSAAAFAQRATDWLRARHAYALSVRIPPGTGDDIVRWLDSNEPGFCEYFAAGFVVLAREAGHPARVVAGFQGGSLNAFENYYMVKNSNAHAWAEIHDGLSHWLRVDPTPGGGAAAALQTQAGEQQALDGSWSARMDSLRVLWYRRIVNFDSRQQVQMIEQVKTFTAGSGAALRVWADELARTVKAWIKRPWDFGRLLRLALIGVSAVALAWLAGRLALLGWRRWRHRGHVAGYDPVRLAAGRQLARLRGLAGGRRPENGEWRMENGERTGDGSVVSRQFLGEREDSLEQVREDLRRLRYGRRETWPEPRAVFKRARAARRAARRS
ncbi:MAG: protein-glutamine gamma-glutamyltransferase [Verrucomicrobiota bacterium]|nr:protein-glutamine gamma-glutamyltransferase [Verrucomicrobiota bacterium]